jgi:dipeptidase
MGSDNILTVAKRTGLWDPDRDGEFDWTRAFALDRKLLHPYATRRMWRVFTMAAPSLKNKISPHCSTFADEYPFSVKPDKKLSVLDIMQMHRDHFEGVAPSHHRTASRGC